jgi:hypothetical protein
VGDPFRASPKVGWRQGGRETAVKAAVGRAPVRGRSGLIIGLTRSGGEAVGGGDAEVPFYIVGGGVGRPGDGGEWAAAMMHHDGRGGGRFRRRSGRAVVGSDEGGGAAPAISGAEGGHREVARTRAREAAVVASVIQPGEKDDRAGLACQ